MWRIFSKDRQSMNIKTIENVLRLHSDQDYSPQHYDHAIELFLSEYPDGTVRKGKRRWMEQLLSRNVQKYNKIRPRGT